MYPDKEREGYVYTVYIRPWKKAGRFEVVKYLKGFRKLWERVTMQEYLSLNDSTVKLK